MAGDPFEVIARFGPGSCVVLVDRRGLALGERGGFDARWPSPDELGAFETVSRERFVRLVREHLRDVASARDGAEPGASRVSLAAERLADDVEGWMRLNWPAPS